MLSNSVSNQYLKNANCRFVLLIHLETIPATVSLALLP